MAHYLKYFCVIALVAMAACASKKDREYASDLTSMSDANFRQKHLTTVVNQKADLDKIKVNQAYYSLGANYSFHLTVFAEDGFTYTSATMPVSLLTAVPTQKLSRSSSFTLQGTTLKLQSMAATPGSRYLVIEEGRITQDTLHMLKEYNATGLKNTQPLSYTFILAPTIKVYKLGSDFFVEGK